MDTQGRDIVTYTPVPYTVWSGAVPTVNTSRTATSFFVLACYVLSVMTCVTSVAHAFDWRSDWAVQSQFSLRIDTEGYQFPTSIAFVPNPGRGPKDPLYFVTELKGKVKVVTNDRSVFTFAENFFRLPPEKLGVYLSIGLAGICLEPKHGLCLRHFCIPG